MNSLQNEFSEKADFLGVYISEAHAKDEWPLGVKFCVEQPKTMDVRLLVANNFVRDYGVKLPMLVDTMANEFDTTFAAWPERFYIVQNGKLALVGKPTTEFGFDRELLRLKLLALLRPKEESFVPNQESEVPNGEADVPNGAEDVPNGAEDVPDEEVVPNAEVVPDQEVVV